MNKNIRTEIAVGIILVIFIVIVGFIWLGSKQQTLDSVVKPVVKSVENQSITEKKSLPATLSSSAAGRDTSGRELKVEDISISNVKFTLPNSTIDSPVKNNFSFQNVKKYTLTTPTGVAPIFYVDDQPQRDGTVKSVEVDVPSGKSIIGVRVIVSNEKNTASLSINPNFLLSVNDIKVAPVNYNVASFSIPGGASVEFEYLFAVGEKTNTFVLSFGENTENPEGRLLVDFGQKNFTSLK
ncbi:MAG: hypothetical protein IPJ67_01100 [Candidatus Moraniibacteriota bacterium]|nr:MAG: hypothetical protein IPJ67_01100 [Candidatus Moranbacteria bacterium]